MANGSLNIAKTDNLMAIIFTISN